MKIALLFTAGGPIVIMTSYPLVPDPGLLERLKVNEGIDNEMYSKIWTELLK